MPGKLLHGFKDRGECHRKLEEVLKEGKHPRSCVREDAADHNRPYQIWSDGPGGNEPGKAEPVAVPASSQDDALADRVARKVLELLQAKPEREKETERRKKERTR